MRGRAIDPGFRERLMLTVTEVNGCRYCSYAHARTALTAGLTEAEVTALAQGDLQSCPSDQAVALLYAQHWADTDGDPDPEARQRLIDTYGEAKASSIELVLQMIRVGNLLGNTWDYVVSRLSFGRLGDRRDGTGS